MADSKVSALTNLAETPANDDEFYLRDASVSGDKAIEAGYVRRDAYSLVTATGNLALNARHYVELSGASAIALTITGAPTVGDTLEIYRVGTGGVTHTVILSGSVTWDGTNETANFADDTDYIRCKAISATRWRVLTNTTVTFS
jgi:hypothetical protein